MSNFAISFVYIWSTLKKKSCVCVCVCVCVLMMVNLIFVISKKIFHLFIYYSGHFVAGYFVAGYFVAEYFVVESQKQWRIDILLAEKMRTMYAKYIELDTFHFCSYVTGSENVQTPPFLGSEMLRSCKRRSSGHFKWP